MKRSTAYIYFLLLAAAALWGQNRQLNLGKAGSQLFHGKVYCYGFLNPAQNKATFCIYRLTHQLKTQDSMVVYLGKAGAENYLQLSSDTLHGFLNVYLQKKEKKLVTILRFSKNFELLATIENVDIARLNGISAFENELLYSGKSVYTIKSQKDSTGQQFYLNKFTLKSELKNFEYEFSWQFAFERQNIQSAHVFYANRQTVMLYVTVSDGPKAGQWLLSINTATGKLMRGTKLNDKGELNTYEFGNFATDTLNKTLLLAGQKFMEAQLRPQENRLSLLNAPFATLYLIEIDSTGELTNKQEFKIPVSDPKTTSKKTGNTYIFRISNITKNKDGNILLETDVFKNSDNTPGFLYANSSLLSLVLQEERLALEKSTVGTNPLIEKFYITPDKTDRNGKVAADSLKEFEKLFYRPLNFPVKQQFKLDPERNPLWVLKKSNPKKNTIAYSFLAPVKKIYQLTPIQEISSLNYPVYIGLDATTFILAQQAEATVYQLNLYNW